MSENNDIHINNLVEKLSKAKQGYYSSAASLFSDDEFDALEEELRLLAPEHIYFTQVGYANVAYRNSKTITHQVKMLSMNKVKSFAELSKWHERLGLPPQTDLIIEPKIDGISASCLYEYGNLVYVSTRGDGKTGQDISHVADFIDDIPKSIAALKGIEGIEIRGELYLAKDTELKIEGPLRNNCAGLVNRKDKFEDLRYVRFVSYQTARQRLAATESAQIIKLRELQLHTIKFQCYGRLEDVNKYYQEYLATYRDRWPYETDGLVISIDDSRLFEEINRRWVVNHHNHYAVAFKPPSSYGVTSLRDLLWQLSRHGSLTPVAKFDSIELGGASIERASLYNLRNVKELKLKLGDSLEVERANEVIPNVRRNINADANLETEAKLIPVNCPACNQALVEGAVQLYCSNIRCPGIQKQKILFWLRQCEVKQIAEATIDSLYNAGKLRSIKDLYTIKVEDFQDLEGFAEKKTQHFIQEIDRTKKMNVIKFLSSLGIPTAQEKSLQNLGNLRCKDLARKLIESLKFGNPDYDKRRNDLVITNLKQDLASFDKLDIFSPELGAALQKACLDVRIRSKNASGLDDFKKVEQKQLESLYGSTLVKYLAKDLDINTKEDLTALIQTCTKLSALKKDMLEGPSEYAILNNLISWFGEPANQALVEELFGVLEIVEFKKLGGEQLVALTGTGPLPRKQIINRINAMGYRYAKTINQGVTILLCEDKSASSSKLEKARANKIQILTYSEFLDRD